MKLREVLYSLGLIACFGTIASVIYFSDQAQALRAAEAVSSAKAAEDYAKIKAQEDEAERLREEEQLKLRTQEGKRCRGVAGVIAMGPGMSVVCIEPQCVLFEGKAHF